MRALVVADIHLDMWLPEQPHPLESITPDEWDELDLVVVAGDLVNAGQDRWSRALRWLGERIDPGRIHAFPGNHDFYDGALDREWRLAAASKSADVQWAQKAEIILSGRRFLCCTLWTDMALGKSPPLNVWFAETGMNDYRLICIEGENLRSARAADTVATHRDHRRWLEERLAAPFDGDTVVVTHHAPHPACNGPFQEGSLAAAYASDLTDLIESYRPALWVHGHTHVASDLTVGATRILNVSIGYPPGLDGRPVGDPRVGILEW